MSYRYFSVAINFRLESVLYACGKEGDLKSYLVNDYRPVYIPEHNLD